MTIHTSIDPKQLQQLGGDVAQLTRPIQVAIRGRVVNHPALLDGLRSATGPGRASDGPSRRGVPGSRPPLRLDPLDALAAVYVELGGWHARLGLPSPGRDADWHKAVMRQLVGAAPELAPAVADWLITDVHGWWSDAAHHTGWRRAELLRLRP